MRGTSGVARLRHINGEVGGYAVMGARGLSQKASGNCPDVHVRLARIVGNRTSPSRW